MKVLNYDIADVNKRPSTGNLLNFPEDVRCIICGPTGCGKTNSVINFICNPGLATNIKAYLQNCHKTVEDRLNPLPCMEEIWKEDYLQNHYVPQLVYQVSKRGQKSKEPLNGLQDLFQNSEHRRIFIEGEAGYGKSTLARKIAFDWALGEKYLSRYEYVHYAELQSVGSMSIKECIVEDLARNVQGDIDTIQKLLWQHQSQTLFILDGLDELAPQERYAKLEHFQHFFAASSILVTTQTLTYNDGQIPCTGYTKWQSLYDCKWVVEGFTSDNVDMFITKIIKSLCDMESDDECDSEDECERENGSTMDHNKAETYVQELKHFISGKYYLNNNLETLHRSPLFLCMLCFVFVNSDCNASHLPDTISGLYIMLMEQLAENYINKAVRGDNNSQRRRVLEKEVETAFTLFGNLVLKSLVEDCTTFTESKIDECLGQHSDHIKKIFFSRKEAKRGRKSAKRGRWNKKLPTYHLVQVHRPFLEYLAAFYICSLQKNERDFTESLHTFLHVRPLIYSKCAKNDGQRPSMLVTFICGLLKDEAYKFLSKLLRVNSYFSHFLDVCYLLQNSSLSNQNLECVMDLQLGMKWDLKWLFGRGFLDKERFKRDLRTSCEILSKILIHKNCPVTKYELYHSDLLHFRKSRCDFELFLQGLQCNSSLKSVTLQKRHEHPTEFELQVYLDAFVPVIQAIVRMEMLEKIKFDADLFIENPDLRDALLKELFTVVGHAISLQALIIKATHLSGKGPHEDLCEDFHDKKTPNRQANKKHAIDQIVTPEHFNILVESLQDLTGLTKLSLPKLTISLSVAAQLSKLLTSKGIKVLRIPEMQLPDKQKSLDALAQIFASLSNPSCSLEDLDVRHFVLDEAEVCCLAEHLKRNMTLKRLNLSGCLNSFKVARPLLEAIATNVTLEGINLSSGQIEVTSEGDFKLLAQMLFSRNAANSISEDGNMKCISLAGWNFTIENVDTLKVLAEAIKNSPLLELCLQKTLLKISVSSAYTHQKLDCVVSEFLRQCPNLEVIDFRESKVQLMPDHSPFSRVDSGFHSMSSFEEDVQSACSDDSLQVNLSDNSDLSDSLSDADLKKSAPVCDESELVPASELFEHTRRVMEGNVHIFFEKVHLLDFQTGIKKADAVIT